MTLQAKLFNYDNVIRVFTDDANDSVVEVYKLAGQVLRKGLILGTAPQLQKDLVVLGTIHYKSYVPDEPVFVPSKLSLNNPEFTLDHLQQLVKIMEKQKF